MIRSVGVMFRGRKIDHTVKVRTIHSRVQVKRNGKLTEIIERLEKHYEDIEPGSGKVETRRLTTKKQPL